MLNSHPLVGASLAALACIAAITAAMDAGASETYAGASIAAGGTVRLNCSSSSSACEHPAGLSGKISGGYLSSLAPANSMEISQGVELMAYTTGRGKIMPSASGSSPLGMGKSSGVGLSQVIQAGTGNFAANARLGISYSHGELTNADGNSNSKGRVAPILGLGIRYTLDKSWSLTTDWDRLPVKYDDKQKATVNLFSFGVSYKF